MADAATMTPAPDVEGLIEDRPGQGIFRVARAIYTRDDVFEAELARIFERGWVYSATRAR